jgi:hypothetical protein
VVSRTLGAVLAALLATLAQFAQYGPPLLISPLDLTARTAPLLAGGTSLLWVLVGPIGVALLGTRLDGDVADARLTTLGLFAVAGAVGDALATGVSVLAAPTPALDPLAARLAALALRGPAPVVTLALAGFAGAAFGDLHRHRAGETRRRDRPLGGPDGSGTESPRPNTGSEN